MLRAVLFDLDGVLVDSYEVWWSLMHQGTRELGYPELARSDFERMWGQGIEKDVEHCFPRHGVPEIESYYEAHFLDHARHLRFDPEAARVLAALAAAGLGTALVTNTPAPLAREVLARGALALDHVVGGTDVPRAKPAPDMVQRACGLLGVEPGEAVVVGDTATDAGAAAAAGVRFVGVRHPGEPRIESLAELPAVLGLPR